VIHYLVAYSYPGGFGSVEVARMRPIADYEDLRTIARDIERNMHVPVVVITNVQRFPL